MDGFSRYHLYIEMTAMRNWLILAVAIIVYVVMFIYHFTTVSRPRLKAAGTIALVVLFYVSLAAFSIWYIGNSAGV